MAHQKKSKWNKINKNDKKFRRQSILERLDKSEEMVKKKTEGKRQH